MTSRLQIFRVIVASGLSLWMAILACLVGCALPALANASQSVADPMADMANCPHHHSGGCPQKPNDKPDHSGTVSCCPQEIKVNPKWSPASLGIVAHSVILHSAPIIIADKDQSFEAFHSPIWHSARDTLLATQLLRI